MKELFLSILNASLYGSIVIAAVLILRLVLKKAPRTLFCLLWLLAGLRLVLPFEIESRFSLQPDMQQIVLQQEEVPQNALPSDQPAQELPPATQVPAVPGDIQLPEDIVIEYNDNAVTDHQQVVIDYVAIAAWVWAAGTAALGIYSIASYRKLKKQVAEAVRMEDGYWETGRIDTAFVLGFFRPRIYLPVGLTEQDRGLILAHEHGHIARGDHWYKPVGYCVLAIHWFNPLVWLAYLCLCRDIEMACDERVVRGMDVQARKDYSRALLNCAGSHRSIAACPVAFGETSVKQRIVSVLNYRKPGFWVMVAAVVALVFVAVCLMTSPDAYHLTDVAGISAGEIQKVSVVSENRMTGFSDPDELRELRKLLRRVRVTPGPGDEIGWDPGEHVLVLGHEEVTILYFSEDCTQVWLSGSVKRRVENPELLREWIAEVTDAVVDREVTGDPFAAKDEPYAWLRGVSADAIREAEGYYASAWVVEGDSEYRSYANGHLTVKKLEELIEILNRLPEGAVREQKTLRRSDFSTLQSYMDGKEGLSVTFYDDVNGLVVVLRMLEGETMELIITDELYNVEDGSRYLDHPGCWVLEDRKLLNFLREMQKNLPIVTMLKSDIRLDEKELWGLKLSAENVTPRGMTLVCEQDGTPVPGMLMTGAFFRLEKLTEDGWRELPTIQDAIFTTEGWVITNGQTHRWDVNWAWLYGELEPGDYRIFKTITLDEIQGSETDWNGGVEFSITGETEPEGDLGSAIKDYTEEELLALCRRITEAFQSNPDAYVHWENRFYSGETLASQARGEYWQSGSNWLRVAEPVWGGTASSHLSVGGQHWFRFGDNGVGDNGQPKGTWTQGTTNGEDALRPWLYGLSWSKQEITLVSTETVGTELQITVTVQGAPPGETSDRVSEYTVCFRIGTNGSLLGTIHSYLADANVGDTRKGISTMDIVENPAGEEAGPGAVISAAYAEIVGYDAEDYLNRCREVLKQYQAQSTYCLMIQRQMSGDILNDNATQMFYVSGEDWLRHCVIDEVDFIEEDWYLNKNGRQFTKYTTHHNHDGNGVDINTGWVEGPREENEILQPWLRTFDLDAQPVDFLGFETDGNLDTVTFRVYGNPLPGDDLMEVADYTVELVFYRDSRTLHKVILRYTQTWSMRVSGEDTTGVGYMVATMTPNAAGEDMVLQMLEAMYNQAITN